MNFLGHPKILDLKVDVPDYSEIPLNGAKIEDYFSTFFAKRDTWLFGKLIESAIRALDSRFNQLEIIDLGCGSGLPSLMALHTAKSPEKIRVLGIDLDGNALEVARKNATHFGFSNQFRFANANILDFFANATKTLDPKSDARIFASNPPYVPIPKALPNRGAFAAVDGGPDGTELVRAIIESATVSKNDLIAVQWSSLTSPKKIIAAIQDRFEIAKSMISEVPFGRLTSSPDVFAYLKDLKADGEIFFSEYDRAPENSYYVIGTVLRTHRG